MVICWRALEDLRAKVFSSAFILVICGRLALSFLGIRMDSDQKSDSETNIFVITKNLFRKSESAPVLKILIVTMQQQGVLASNHAEIDASL